MVHVVITAAITIAAYFLGLHVYASLDTALKPLSPGLEGALAFKNDISIHTNPYRNKDFAESDQWLAGWNLAASFKPSSKISGIKV